LIDFTPIFEPLISALPYLLGLVVLSLVVKSAWFKGKMGEFVVSTLIKLSLNKDSYHLINDVTLMTAQGTTQIDQIIVSRYGVFVIETKNYKGWIFGSERQRQWTQKIYKKSYKFMNPLHQNYKHVEAVRQMLDLPSSAVHSIVVFIGEATFKTNMPSNVVRPLSMIRLIKSYKQDVFSTDETKQIISGIEANRLKRGYATNKQHVGQLSGKSTHQRRS